MIGFFLAVLLLLQSYGVSCLSGASFLVPKANVLADIVKELPPKLLSLLIYSCSLFPLALSMKTPSIILLPIYSQSQIKARFHLGGVPAGYKFIAAQNAIKSR